MRNFISYLSRKAKKTPRYVQLRFELLETRLVPVVGASVPAPIVEPGSNLDGVVSLTVGNGLNPSGSGSELADQRLILTAAHVIAGRVRNLNVFLAAGGSGYSVGQTFTMPAVFGGNPNGMLDTGAQPLSIRIATLGPNNSIATFTVLNPGLYVRVPAAATANQAFVQGFNAMDMPAPTAQASFTFTATPLPGGSGNPGQVPVVTVNFNLQRDGNPVNISIPVPRVAGNVIAPGAGVINNMITPGTQAGNDPAGNSLAYNSLANVAALNDIGLVVLRDPLIPAPPGQNQQMIAPFRNRAKISYRNLA